MPAPAAPPTHIMVTRGDARLQVLAQGEGHPIVLLPSLGRGARDFDAIAASLATVLMLRAVPLLAAGMRSFERPIPSG